MIAHRTSAVIALLAFVASAVAVAQTPPPASADPGNSSATTVPNPHETMSNDTPTSNGASPSSATQSAPDPKVEQCVAEEKAKSTGLSENQLKQKCMLKIASDQGKGH
jgi:cytoskeletal protein RodZ